VSAVPGERAAAFAETVRGARAGDGKVDEALRQEGASLGAVPQYPVDALPVPAQELVEHGQASCLPTALLGGAALGALAAAIGPGSQIEVTRSWHERAILWVPLLAPRGAGKSPAQDLAFGPLRDHDAQLSEEDDGEAILLGDQTLEALARNLHAAEGAGALDLDELAVLLRGLGEYKRGGGGDRGRFLALWSGAPWKFTRVGAGGKKKNEIKLHITRPTLVVCGGLQPVLHELLGGEEDGLRPRWLPHLAEMPTQLTLGRERPPTGWQLLLSRDLAPKRRTSRTWRLGERALDAFESWRRIWKTQSREAEEAASTSAALVKADVHLARITLALAEGGNPGKGGEVDPEVVAAAAQIVNFTLDCWRALPEQGTLALSRRDEVLDRGITRLVGWLEEHGGEASRRELQRAHVAGVRTAADLDALLDRYQAVHPGTLTEAGQLHGRGVPTTVVRAPARRGFVLVSPNGDTRVSTDENPHGKAESGAVATGDTTSGDTTSLATAEEDERAARLLQLPLGDGEEAA
jgi:hypothetical protein